MSWAPYRSWSLSPSIRVCTLRRAVNGGSTATSTAAKSLAFRLNASFWVSASASKWLLCIFQLPATSGLRPLLVVMLGLDPGLGVVQRLEARQGGALQVLQAGAAASGDVAERVLGEAELTHGGRGVAAADHGQPGPLGDGLGHGQGARRERGELEHADRAVPEHRGGVGQLGREQL